MIRTIFFRLLTALSISAAAVSCAHPDQQARVDNGGAGSSGSAVTQVPIDQSPQPPAPSLPPGDAKVRETGVRKAESAWMAALNQHSLDALDGLTAERFVLVSPDGSTLEKDEFIGLIRDGRLIVQSETIGDASVVEYGNAAFITGVVKVEATRDGSDISGSYRFADTWLWTSGSWKKAAGVFLAAQQ
jgi:ketosteroid isomerase-like protein